MHQGPYNEGKAAGYLGSERSANPYKAASAKASIYGEYASDWESGWQHGRDNRSISAYDYCWRTKR